MTDAVRKVQALKKAISHERLQGYLSSGANDATILAHYVWNIELCESLYPSLQCLEVAYRNSLFDAIAEKKGSNWMVNESPWLNRKEIASIGDAKYRLRERGKKDCNTSALVAEMHFGFWISLLDVRYERTKVLWPAFLIKTFPKTPKHLRKRNIVSSRFSKIRHIRNSAFHHKPIWHWNDLKQQHDDIVEMVCWISPEMGQCWKR